jgi:tetratricopeptide (TPR) repeat protein
MFNLQVGESAIFDLNKLENVEVAEMRTILDVNGLWGENSKLSDKDKRRLLVERQKGNRELQGIMLGILQSTSMRDRIAEVVQNIKNMSDEYFEILILALLIKVMSLNIRANDMSKILNVGIALDTRFTNDSNVQEILEFSSGEAEFKLRSAVTANEILKELDCNEMIIKVLSQTAIYANRYFRIERYENVLKNIISYSHVKTFLTKSGQKEAFLINYYDCLKELDYYKENSFYWLQYSIACTNVERYDLAQTYLDNAYSWFRNSEKVVPFQIDTQQAKLNLLLIEKRRTKDVKGKFIQAHELLMKPIVSDKDNPVKQIMNFRSYTKKTIKDQMLNGGYRKEYYSCCAEAYNKVNEYLKNQHVKSDEHNFKELSKKLLKCSVGDN